MARMTLKEKLAEAHNDARHAHRWAAAYEIFAESLKPAPGFYFAASPLLFRGVVAQVRANGHVDVRALSDDFSPSDQAYERVLLDEADRGDESARRAVDAWRAWRARYS